MIIANPIYDKTFKRIMENDKVAKFFIGTLLDEEIVELKYEPQEFTYFRDLDPKDPKVLEMFAKQYNERVLINVFRLDFIATIKTKTGEFKKILIEIQKAKNQVDLMRFRKYLAEQYKKEDEVEGKRAILPITTIYILGFILPEIDSPCIKVERHYTDLIENRIINKKNDFIERLTHDSFVVQVNRITDRYQTSLDKLLSVFEQSNFIDDDKITKLYKHPTDLEEIKIITDILHHSGTDPEEREEIEKEREAWRSLNALFEGKEMELLEKIEKHKIEIAKQEETLKEQGEALKEQGETLKEQEETLKEQEETLKEKDKVLEEKDKVLKEKDKVLEKKDKVLEEKDRLIEELRKKIENSKQ